MKKLLENVPKIDLDDGVYDLEGIKFLLINSKTVKANVKRLLEQYPNTACLCSTYNVEATYLLSRKPQLKVQIDNRSYPNFQGHGTLTVIKNCPRNILIIGQND